MRVLQVIPDIGVANGVMSVILNYAKAMPPDITFDVAYFAEKPQTRQAEVEALGGAPGVHSARYATDGHDFAANNRLLLKNLEGAENRRARFRTVISLILGGEEHLFEGVVEGRIIDREAGHEGFGYDPLFVPDGYTKTFAEMTTEEKNAVSHRARAVRKLAAYLHSTER